MGSENAHPSLVYIDGCDELQRLELEIQPNTRGVEEATLVNTFEWLEGDSTLDTQEIQVALSVDPKWNEDHGPNSLPPRPPAVDRTPCGPLSRWWPQLVASLELPLGIRRISWG
jgi:hypothetical protein